jgi:hypothetical protein
MTHEWLDVIARTDRRPAGKEALLVGLAIRQALELPAEERWDAVVDAVVRSPETAERLCDAYLLHFCAIGGRRVAA